MPRKVSIYRYIPKLIQAYTCTLSESRAQIAQLTHQLEAEHSEKAGLAADKHQLRKELDTANAKIDQLEEAVKSTEKELLAKDNELQVKEARLDEATKREVELVAKMAELERVIESKDKEVLVFSVLYVLLCWLCIRLQP